MKEHEKLADEYAEPTPEEKPFIDPLIVLASKSGYDAGFLKAREMAIAEVLKEHLLSELVPSGVFIILERLGEKEV